MEPFQQLNPMVNFSFKAFEKVLDSPSFLVKSRTLDVENAFTLKMLGFYVLDTELRKTHCPDCMFHSNAELPRFGKEDLLGLARRLVLTQISFADATFNYTCNQAGIKCDSLWGRNYKNGEWVLVLGL